MSKKTKEKVEKTVAAEATTVVAEATPVAAQAESDIDSELAELLADMPAAPAIEAAAALPAATAETLEEIDAELTQADTIAAVKAESYAGQETDGSDMNTAEPEGDSSVVIQMKTAKVGKVKKAKTPRAPSTAGQSPSKVLESWGEEGMLKAAFLTASIPANDEQVEQLKANVDGLAKKVGEKAINLLKHRLAPQSLQTYTRTGMNLLVERGEITSKELFDTFSESYKEGTARSQCNQLMQLLPALKVASREGSKLTLNADSAIYADFKTALSAAA